MSWGLHRSSHRKSSRSPVKMDLLPVHDASLRRQPYGTSGLVHGHRELLYAPGGAFSQPTDPAVESSALQSNVISVARADEDQWGLEPSEQSQLKEKQWKKWENETIPLLLQPYIHLLRETASLRNLSGLRQHFHPSSCSCINPHLLNVACIYFESKFCISSLHIN
jgi:hypothetical protein